MRRLADAFRLAALGGNPSGHVLFVQRWHDLHTRAPLLVRIGAAITTWDLDKTDRARVWSTLDALAAQGRVTR